MVAVKFYQVQQATPAGIEAVLPTLLEKMMEREQRIVVQCGSTERVQRLQEYLWTYEPASFLPHGTVQDGDVVHQPILLVEGEEGALKKESNAPFLLRLPGTDEAPVKESFDMIIEVFNKTDAQVFAARKRWVAYKKMTEDLAFFAQSEKGWQKQA